VERNYRKAIQELSLVTRDNSRSPQPFYFLGLAQLQTRQLNQAKKSLVKAKELSPRWLPPRLALAQMHLAAGDSDLAWQESEKILEMQPKNMTGLLIGGASRLRVGDLEKALDMFKKAEQLNPKQIEPHINIGGVYYYQKKYDQALDIKTTRPQTTEHRHSILITQS